MSGLATVTLRRPTEADHGPLVERVDDWFGRRARHLVRRWWFRHFAGTSWLAEDGRGRPAGVLIGYRSPDAPDTAVIHLVAVEPNRRRHGVGRALVGAFLGDPALGGVRRVEADLWPDEPAAIAFLRALGFEAEDGPGSMRLYGTPAFADHEGPGEDRARFVLSPSDGG